MKRSMQKSYIVLFTWVVIRAIHLELAIDMTAASFLCAFRRIISRMSIPGVICSDNAHTFTRSNEDLTAFWKVIRDQEAQNNVSNKNVNWKSIMEKTPWWGTFCERLVKTVERPLMKALGRLFLNTDAVATILTEIEAAMNSRTLTYV